MRSCLNTDIDPDIPQFLNTTRVARITEQESLHLGQNYARKFVLDDHSSLLRTDNVSGQIF